ncbi:MAG TPA: hypothetical protein VF040_14405 [Ktedonobacterales bacterium]
MSIILRTIARCICASNICFNLAFYESFASHVKLAALIADLCHWETAPMRIVHCERVAYNLAASKGLSGRAMMTQAGGWERRLYSGLRLPGIEEPQSALTRALGEVGVEAEYFLLLTGSEASLSGLMRGAADQFLQHLEDSCRRICAAAASLEVATQGYLTALDARYPQAHLADTVAEPWWPAFSGLALPGESLEMRLRRCGYSYRHAVTAHLGSNIDAIAEQLALTLHALHTLPPAGVLPIPSLYHGLYEVSSALQGYIVPHHIIETATESPGLLMGIDLLRLLDQREDHSLQADITWAQAQLAQARETLARLGKVRAPKVTPDTAAWVARSIRDWEDALAQLLSIAREAQAVRR